MVVFETIQRRGEILPLSHAGQSGRHCVVRSSIKNNRTAGSDNHREENDGRVAEFAVDEQSPTAESCSD